MSFREMCPSECRKPHRTSKNDTAALQQLVISTDSYLKRSMRVARIRCCRVLQESAEQKSPQGEKHDCARQGKKRRILRSDDYQLRTALCTVYGVWRIVRGRGRRHRHILAAIECQADCARQGRRSRVIRRGPRPGNPDRGPLLPVGTTCEAVADWNCADVDKGMEQRHGALVNQPAV